MKTEQEPNDQQQKASTPTTEVAETTPGASDNTPAVVQNTEVSDQQTQVNNALASFQEANRAVETVVARRTQQEVAATPAPVVYKTWHYIRVVGREGLYSFGEYTSESSLKKLAEIYPPEEQVIEDHHAHLLIYNVPEEATKNAWRKTTKNALLCAYNSTNQFLQNNLGCRLDSDDESWYKNHPWTTSSGLPAEHTIAVLNELVRPYGCGVSHVYVRKGFVAYDEHRDWYDVLGVNPMAIGDKLHSNSDYIEEIVGMVSDDIKDAMRAKLVEECKDYRFEYVDQLPERALVTCAGGYDEKHPSTTGGGHASYHGPRSRGYKWEIAVAFDRIENCLRLKEPQAIPDSGDGVFTLDWMDILAPEDSEHKGKTMRQVIFSYPRTYSPWEGGDGYYPNNQRDHSQKNQRGLFGKNPPKPPRKPGKSRTKDSGTQKSGRGAGSGTNGFVGRGLGGQIGDHSRREREDMGFRALPQDLLDPQLVQRLAAFSDRYLGRSAWELADYEWKTEDEETIMGLTLTVAQIFLKHDGPQIAELHAQDSKPLYWSDVFHLQSSFTKAINDLEREVLDKTCFFQGSLTLHGLYQLEESLLEVGIDPHFVEWYIRKMV